MKKIAIILAIAASSAFAQPAQQPAPTVEQLQQVVTVLRQQRDQAMQQAQDIAAQLQILSSEHEKLKKQLEEVTKPVAEKKPSVFPEATIQPLTTKK